MADIIKGVPELSAAFKRIGQDMERRVSRVMVAAAGGVVRAEARALALGYGFKRTGALIKNIVIKREKTQSGTTQYNLGVRHGRNLTKKQKAAPGKRLVVKGGRIQTRYANDPFYWRFLELGWRPHGTGAKIPGRSFIGQALSRKRQAAIDAMSERLNKELAK